MNVKYLNLFLLFIPITTIVSCAKIDTNNQNVKKLDKWEVSDSNFYTQEQEEYYIVIHSNFCTGCHYLKPYVEDYQSVMESKQLTYVYLFNVTSNENILFSNNEEMVINQKGNNDIYSTYFYITPSLYGIKNGKLNSIEIDYNKIRDMLEDVGGFQ